MLLHVAVVAHANGVPILCGCAAIGIAGHDCPTDPVRTRAGTPEFTVEFGIICMYFHKKGKKEEERK